MPFEITNPRHIWTWQTPAEGETVPDYPPVDLTPYITDIRIEHDDAAHGPGHGRDGDAK